MTGAFERTRWLIGDAGLTALANSHVIVFGAGGVGGFACEALARSGVGEITVVDGDVVTKSNLNRQLVALNSTLGQNKADIICRRITDINPECLVHPHPVYYTRDNWDDWPLAPYDAVVDAIDMVSAKLELAVRAQEAGVFMVSAMGAGNRVAPLGFLAADIANTAGDPLARVMRRELKRRGVNRLRVVYSALPPVKAQTAPEPGRHPPGSMVFSPGTAGLLLAHEAVAFLLARS